MGLRLPASHPVPSLTPKTMTPSLRRFIAGATIGLTLVAFLGVAIA